MDAAFAFFENLEFQTSFAQTRNPGVRGDDTTYRARMQYDSDLWGVTVDQIGIGASFDPAVGFLRRGDMQRTFVQSNYTPRPAGLDAIRQFTFQGQLQYIENNAGQVETREYEGQFRIQFENSDQWQVQYTDGYELLPFDFEVFDGVVVPRDGYGVDTVRVGVTLGQQRRVSGSVSVERSRFYGGHRWSYGYSRGRVNLHPQLSIEPGLVVNRVTTPFGDFITQLVSSRVTHTATPLMFISGLLQYNSGARTLNTNVRMRWEYQPGSELFVVYTDGRTTDGDGFPDMRNRSFVVKFNRLFRF